jgi:hypothetical protein
MTIAVTFDIDWAPDFVIDEVADILARRSVRATWFATHASPAVDCLRSAPQLFEVGIHPNFFEGSTHGSTSTEVLHHCMRLVPEARSVRTHGLFQSSHLLNQIMALTPIRLDASLFLPGMEHLRPLEYWWGGESMTRVPTFWADDFELQRGSPNFDAGRFDAVPGLRVLAFHPIHVFVNANAPSYYGSLKRRVPTLTSASHDDLACVIRQGRGVRTLLEEIVERLSGGDSFTLAELGR